MNLAEALQVGMYDRMTDSLRQQGTATAAFGASVERADVALAQWNAEYARIGAKLRAAGYKLPVS